MNKLPYLNILEVDRVEKNDINNLVVIDKEDEVKLADPSILGISDYNELSNKPSINDVPLVGNVDLGQFDIPTTDYIDTAVTNKIEEIDINGVPLGDPLEPDIEFNTTHSTSKLSFTLGNIDKVVDVPVFSREDNTAGIVTSYLYTELSDKYTKAEVDSFISNINSSLITKQGKLIPGDNIIIENDVISTTTDRIVVNLDSDIGWSEVYNKIRSNPDAFIYGYFSLDSRIAVVPLMVYNRAATINLLYNYILNDIIYVRIYSISETGTINRDVKSYPLTVYYTKTEIDQRFGDYVLDDDFNNYTQGVDSSITAINESLSTLGGKFDDYYTKSQVDESIQDLDDNFDDYYTKEETDNKYQPKGDYLTEASIANKQDTLVSGTNIKTINGSSILGSGNLVIDTVPVLYYDGSSFAGGFQDVFNAINNHKSYEIYLPYNNNLIKATNVFISGSNITANVSVTNKTATNYISYVIRNDGTFVNNSTSTNLQDKLSAGNNIVISNNTVDWSAPEVQFINKIEDDGSDIKYTTTNFYGGEVTQVFPTVTTTTAGLMSPADKIKLNNIDTGGVSDYNDLTNKPQINGVTLSGNQTASALGLASSSEIDLIKAETNNKIADLANKSITSVAGALPKIVTIRAVTQSEYNNLTPEDSTLYIIV